MWVKGRACLSLKLLLPFVPQEAGKIEEDLSFMFQARLVFKQASGLVVRQESWGLGKQYFSGLELLSS